MRERLVRNRSGRGGVRPRLIILHTTEGHNRPGRSDLDGLAGWFDNPAADASSHRGIDAEGHEYLMVPDAEKAWTSGSPWNDFSLNIEQIGFASEHKKYWIKDYHRGLLKTAETIADWSIKYGIPLKHSTRSGVCQHRHVSGPGGHSDCGPGYPEAYVIYLARLSRWKKQGRPRKGRLRARFYRSRILAQQQKYAGKKLGT